MARGRGIRGGAGRIAGERGRGAGHDQLPPTPSAPPCLPTIAPAEQQQPEVMRLVQVQSVASTNVHSLPSEDAPNIGLSQHSDSPAQTSVNGEERPVPADPLGTNRRRIIVDRGILAPSAECSRRIRSIFQERFDEEGARWVLVSNETKEFYFEEFKKYFYWDAAIDHLVKEAWLTKTSTRYSDMICKLKLKPNRPAYVPESVWIKWKEAWREPEIVRISQQNAKNRRGGVDDGSCPSTHNGGSISTIEHGKRLEKQYNRPPTPFEVFRRTHTKNGDGETFTSDKARTVHDRYIALVEERNSLGGTVDENSLYYEAAGGIKKKKMFGMGTQASVYYDNASSSACRASNTHNVREVNQQVQAAISSIEQKMDEMVEERMQRREMEIRASLTEEIRASVTADVRASVTEEMREMREMQRQMQEQMQQILGSHPVSQPSDRAAHSPSDGT